jgi:polar amino acid transport system substrate-binding protein
MQSSDFFWNQFQKRVTDSTVQEQFAKFVPRPGNNLAYPTGSTMQC